MAAYYDPNIKSYDSAVRRVKNSHGVPNQIRQLTDVYRASIILSQLDDIPITISLINDLFNKYNFKIVYFKNTFEKPWDDGYRDLNYRLKDLENQGLIGELQIQLCSVKKFTEEIGHKSYEIIREITDMEKKKIITPYMNNLTRYGYDKAVSHNDSNCIDDFKKAYEKYKTKYILLKKQFKNN